VEEAIRLATDETAAHRFLDAFVIQSRAGWGNGPRLGVVTTPFARVVQTTLLTRKQGLTLTARDVSLDLIGPELHVVIVAQPAALGDLEPASVRSVAMVGGRGVNPGDVVLPTKTDDLTDEYRRLTGTSLKGAGIVARFPLDTLTTGVAVRVVFDRMAQGASPSSMCRECTVPLNVSRMK
jgi:hypothetical protein